MTLRARNRLLFSASAFAIALAAFGVGRWSRGPADHALEHPPAAEATTAAQVWTCSMHPQVRQPNPGKCPICAMDLIPLANGASDSDDGALPRLRLGERTLALLQIRTAPVVRAAADTARELRLPARLEIDETRLHTIAARFPGRVERLHVAATGAPIAAGQPLLDLFSPELFTAQEEFLHARTLAPVVAAAAGDKLRLLGLSSEQIDQIAARGTAEPILTVLAPSGGVALERRVAVGDYVATGDPLFVAADLSVLWAQAEAYEPDLAWLRPGQPVALALPALPGEHFAGAVAFVDPVLDPVKRTARVRIEIPNTDGRLRPGLLATAAVRAAPVDAEPPLVVPATAPLLTGRRAIVYVRESSGEPATFAARAIELGPRLGEVYAVRQGLAEGELVVVHGQFKLDSELQIRGRPSMMTADAIPVSSPAIDPRRPPVPRDFAPGVDAAFGRELVPVLEAYLDFVAHLAADDPAAAGRSLRAIRSALERIGPHRLSGPAHAAWMEDYDRLLAPLRAVPRTADLAALRAPLQEITLALEAIYVTYGAGQLPPVVRAHCPMVEGGFVADGLPLGTWLQRAGTLANPYWGAAMLTCGEFHGQLP